MTDPDTISLGGKAAGLARLDALAAALGVAVPRWTVLGADRFTADAPLPDGGAAELRDLLRGAGLTAGRLAVRSSAVGEDGQHASFAGQFATVLGVPADDLAAVADAVKTVRASANSAHAAAYAADKLAGPVRMAVIFQQLVEPRVSGVAFSVDPVSGDPETAVVNAVYGLGEGLVSGELDGDVYRVGPTGAVSATLATKTQAMQIGPAGRTALTEVPSDRQNEPSLSDDEARRIASVVRRLAERLGAAQDVEWALGDGLFLLQTRPVTTAVRTGERRIWDNSNIVESYGGVTTPLTFGFARSVYADVYRQFCGVMGVSTARLDQNQPVFDHMLGLIRGRVYYNLLSWYRALALLPGFGLNRDFMERMMGVREALPGDLVGRLAEEAVGGRWTDLGRVARMIARLIGSGRTLKTDVPRFHQTVASVLTPLRDADLAEWTPDALRDLYRRLERDLLRSWAVPLTNDFLAMIAFGILSKLVARWLPDEPPTLMNDLLIGTGDIVSTEPARLVRRMADLLESAHLDGEPDSPALLDRLRAAPAAAEFLAMFDGYIDRFGDRTTGELKLETITFRERPGDLLDAVRRARSAPPPDPDRPTSASARAAAETTVRRQLSLPKRVLFNRVLAMTRARVRDRENLRLERTRVFGVVRRIALGFGAQLAARNVLDAPRDVFYLTFDELFGWTTGTGCTLDLRGIVAARRTEFAGYDATEPPPERFETWGPPSPEPADWVVTAAPPSEAAADGELRGIGCCPGIVRAPVRVVRDPTNPGELAGHILVAERTDPGWTLLFPAVRGLLVERGSLLSHSAIVARELGLPCVVSVAGLMTTLTDGELVEMNGATGTIQRLD